MDEWSWTDEEEGLGYESYLWEDDGPQDEDYVYDPVDYFGDLP